MRGILWGSLIGIGLVCGCASAMQQVTYARGKEWVALKETPKVYRKLAPFQHPKSLNPAQIQAVLDHIFYQENVVISLAWGKLKPVFTAEQKNLLAEQLAANLQKAKPSQVVAFSLRNSEKPREVTEGFSFLEGNELHLIFKKIRTPDYWTEQKPYQPAQDRWRLVPQKEQHLFASHGEKREDSRWLVVNLKPHDRGRETL